MFLMLFANFMLQLSSKNPGTTAVINSSPLNSVSGIMAEINPGDPNSFSNSHQIRVTHLHLELDVNFEESKLAGVATVSLKREIPYVNEVILDVRDLNIFKVFDAKTQQALEFKVAKDTKAPEFMGQKLVIKLPDLSETYNVSINYETTKKCSALQWLQPEQTAGKKYPYLFSQCEAIHARSMVPCQDTPSVKASYTAAISAPKDVTVLMSAVKSEEKENPEKGSKTQSFNQKVPIPSYLIAIVVGALEKRKISERIDVWSEKEMVDKGAYEFAEAETMLKTAEKLVGPYIWGRYDILILPPSFPFGGMENPCLTFVTPTVLAGDRSLADVIAHEISHSWTGNLVTNTNFEHFWLNEGFTVYVERLIDGEMFGEQFRQFKSIGGWKVLLDEIQTQTATGPFTKLIWDLTNEDPDEAFSSVPYEKGFSFLYYLEQVVEGKENFTNFLREYIDHFKYQSIDSKQWMHYLLNYFPDNEKLKAVDFDAWFHNPGLPPVTPQYDQTLEQACIDLSQKWINAKTSADFEKFSIDDIKNLHSAQVQEFLTLIRQNGALPIENLKQMEKVYKFDEVNNCEIKCQWIQLGLLSEWREIIPFAIKFVTEQGRMKYLKPIYRGLYSWEETRQLAIDTFLKHKDEMMYIAVVAVARELHIKP